VIYCAHHCVYVVYGTPTMYLGGATPVGLVLSRFFLLSKQNTNHYIISTKWEKIF